MVVNEMLAVPKKLAIIVAPALLKALCPRVKAGNEGVGMSGDQLVF